MDFNALWEAALGELSSQMTQATFDTWLRGSRCVGCEDGVVVVAVKSELAQDWLENRLQAMITRTLARVAKRVVGVRFVVEEDVVPGPSPRRGGEQEDPSPSPTGEGESGAVPAEERGFVVPEFDVHTAGWFPVSEYECRFWAPLLGRVGWRVWEIVRKADRRKKKTEWTPVQRWTAPALAEQVPCGRQALVGVKRRVDGEEEWHHHPGAFERLVEERAATVEKRGKMRHTTYWISVRVRLGLLRPDQVARLAARLQVQHDRWLAEHGFDAQEWDFVE